MQKYYRHVQQIKKRTRGNPSTSGKDDIMYEELYNELREIEDRLYDIANENGGVIDTELGDAWSAFYSYLEKVKPIQL